MITKTKQQELKNKSVLFFDVDGIMVAELPAMHLEKCSEEQVVKDFEKDGIEIADYYLEDMAALVDIVMTIQDDEDPFQSWKDLWKEDKSGDTAFWISPLGDSIPFFTGSQKEAIGSLYHHIMQHHIDKPNFLKKWLGWA